MRTLDEHYAIEMRYVALCSAKGGRFRPEGYRQTEEEADAVADAWIQKQERNTMGPTRPMTLVVPISVLIHKKQPAVVLGVMFGSGLPDEMSGFLGPLSAAFGKTLPIWPTAESVSSLASTMAKVSP